MRDKKKSTVAASNASRIRRAGKWLFILILKMAFLSFFILFIYGIYLDSKVKNKFEGQRWQVPIQVFAEVEHYAIGQRLSLNRLKVILKANRYQRVISVARPGDFALSNNRIIIYRRAFDFGEGLEASIKITLDVVKGRINRIYVNGVAKNQVKLEPLLLDRILPKSKEDRVLVSLEAIPEILVDMLLLVEDRNFYFHHGVSPLGILRALYQNIKAGRTVQGGSTLTQQLVKNMFLTRKKTIWRKVNEALMSLILEYRYSKDQLLEAYINEVYLGQHYANGIYGFGLAAEFYFGQSIQSLTLEQMAMLIGQIKGPSSYDPWRFPKRSLKRRDLVLKLMYQNEYIDKTTYEQAVSSPLSIRKNRRVVQKKFPAYLQVVKAELSEYLSDHEQQSGVRVFTGFSGIQQLILQQSIDKKMPEFERKAGENLQVAMIVTDFKTGSIKALVGDKKAEYDGFNRAITAKRPIGSLIKPAIFLAALERYEHFNLATVLEDKAMTLSNEKGQHWRPKNYDGKYRGQVLLVDALVHSLNIPSVNLGMQLGLENIAQAFQLLGIDDELIIRPSSLLGAVNLSPMQVNQFYLPIANRGMSVKSHAINKIISANGETLWQFQENSSQIISSQASYLLDHALTKVTTEGTARSLTWRLKNKTLAGKTGTTNKERDSWFVGYDDTILVTTWLGRDDNKPTTLTGSSGALVLFAEFMKNNGVISRKNKVPERVNSVYFDNKTGMALAEPCHNSRQLPAVSEVLSINKSCTQATQHRNDEEKKKKSWFEKLFG